MSHEHMNKYYQVHIKIKFTFSGVSLFSSVFWIYLHLLGGQRSLHTSTFSHFLLPVKKKAPHLTQGYKIMMISQRETGEWRQ